MTLHRAFVVAAVLVLACICFGMFAASEGPAVMTPQTAPGAEAVPFEAEP